MADSITTVPVFESNLLLVLQAAKMTEYYNWNFASADYDTPKSFTLPPFDKALLYIIALHDTRQQDVTSRDLPIPIIPNMEKFYLSFNGDGYDGGNGYTSGTRYIQGFAVTISNGTLTITCEKCPSGSSATSATLTLLIAYL